MGEGLAASIEVRLDMVIPPTKIFSLFKPIPCFSVGFDVLVFLWFLMQLDGKFSWKNFGGWGAAESLAHV